MAGIQSHALSAHVQRQYAQAPEGVAVRVAGALAGVHACVADHPPDERGTLPVGSVEFVREALRRQGARNPAPIDYPASIQQYLHRAIAMLTLKDAIRRGGLWAKPLAEKAFEPGLPGDLVESGVDSDAWVWASEIVSWLCEYRCYVHAGSLLWMHRYDPDGADDAPAPDAGVVNQMIADYSASGEAPDGYAIDVGVLSTGQTALVEVNDGFGLGYYGPVENRRARGYLDLLMARYRQIATNES